MRMDAGNHMSSGFTAVKQAFESTYDCLGITCEDIGGLEHYELAEACVPQSDVAPKKTVVSEDTGPDTALIVVVALVSVLLVAMCIVAAAFMMKAKKYKQLYDQSSSTNTGVKPDSIGVQV